MPPRMQGYGGAPNSMASHYQQYPPHTQPHTAGLPPPGSIGNQFMSANSMSNAFANGANMGIPGGFSAPGLPLQGGGLASQAAQMSFAAAPLQQQGHNGMADSGTRGMRDKGRIRDVWKGNLHEEMAILRQLVDKYPYISMDAKFPGIVARPMGSFNGRGDYHYQCLRCNVDLLKLIQLGITLFSEDGESLPATPYSDSGLDRNSAGRRIGNGVVQVPCTWQFNFKFSLSDDMYAEKGIDERKAAGTDFSRLKEEGIDPFEFGAVLISSGLVCDEEKRWISGHAGYDFGYLTKIMLQRALPDDEREFDMLMKKFFPSVYDIKYLMQQGTIMNKLGQLSHVDAVTAELLQRNERHPNLEAMIDVLKVKRLGAIHQAGSDSLVNGRVFFKLRERLFDGEIGDEHLGRVFGINLQEANTAATTQQTTPQHYNQYQENTTPNQNGSGSSFANGAPSTPNNGNANLATTPAHNNNGGNGLGPLTPSNGGGSFGHFQYANKQ
ncbi:29ce4554-32b8-46b6-a119-a303ea5d68b5 [Sclerotinia trifoliorum]|uniref:poly(A)-specific ribonuclease n=1 Tax=Sclerotinia trifoliorum TaxID=28548 RepID=A0A8H2ZYI2_9HELO|nr:29ce4554-32b8-46b6-a119-a303ea5d68b5 [Sclerotinia trifoliorum]